MRYSIEPRNRIYVKGYGFLSFAKNTGNKYRCNKSCFKKSNLKNSRRNW